ncbi:MAG: hypothetical protein ACJAX9_002871 [Celeribacter sp.]|jgi:hypothetical protein
MFGILNSSRKRLKFSVDGRIGREGLRSYLTTIAQATIADFVRFNSDGQMAEHWDVVQLMPEPDYDPMRPSNTQEVSEIFGICLRLTRASQQNTRLNKANAHLHSTRKAC